MERRHPVQNRAVEEESFPWKLSHENNRNGALIKHSPFLFKWPSVAKVGVRQLLVVGVAPLMNELSLLSGFLFAALLFRGLFLSCHIVVLLLSFELQPQDTVWR